MKNNSWNSANLEFVQESNRLLVLNILRNKEPISRAEISKITGLSPTTVGYVINELIESNLARETGAGVSNGGKRPILVEFNPKCGHILAVLINEFKVVYAVTDLNAEIEMLEQIDLEGRKGDEAVNFLIVTIEQALKKADQLKLSPSSISIGISGIVNSKKGEVLYSANLGWNNLKLKSILEKQFDLDIFIIHDMNAAVYGEKLYRTDINVSNLLYVMIGKRIGAGMIINNKIFEGYNGSALEFGHISVNINGRKCECGNYGCITEYVSELFIVKRVVEEIGKGKETCLNNGNVTIDDIIKAVDNHDPLAVEIIRESAFNLAIGIANLVNLFNPQMIVITGDGIVKCDFYFQELKKGILSMALKTAAGDLVISRGLVEQAFLKGIAAIAIEANFELPRVKTTYKI